MGLSISSSKFEIVCLSNIHREPTTTCCGEKKVPAIEEHRRFGSVAPLPNVVAYGVYTDFEQPFDKSTHVRRNSDHNPLLLDVLPNC